MVGSTLRSRAARAGLFIVSVALLGCAGCRTTTALDVPLSYRPTATPDIHWKQGQMDPLKVYLAPVEDLRTDKRSIGVNLECKRPVPISDTVDSAPVELVYKVFKHEMGAAGLLLTDDAEGADRVVTLSLTRFWCHETRDYNGVVSVLVEIKNKNGKTLMREPVTGDSKRFGLSLSEENYNETFSDATLRAAESMLNDETFQESF